MFNTFYFYMPSVLYIKSITTLSYFLMLSMCPKIRTCRWKSNVSLQLTEKWGLFRCTVTEYDTLMTTTLMTLVATTSWWAALPASYLWQPTLITIAYNNDRDETAWETMCHRECLLTKSGSWLSSTTLSTEYWAKTRRSCLLLSTNIYPSVRKLSPPRSTRALHTIVQSELRQAQRCLRAISKQQVVPYRFHLKHPQIAGWWHISTNICCQLCDRRL
jgi:hypothetical protein